MVGNLNVILVFAILCFCLFGLVHLNCADEAVRVLSFDTEIGVGDYLVVDSAALGVHEGQVVFVVDLVGVDVLLAGFLGLNDDPMVGDDFLLVFPEADERKWDQ